MLSIQDFQFGLFGVNTYVVWNPTTLKAVIFDPGMMNPTENSRLSSFVANKRLQVTQVYNTHMHVDHIFGNSYATTLYGVGSSSAQADAFLGEHAAAQSRQFMLPVTLDSVVADTYIGDGDVVDICGEQVKVFAVPGHSPGSLAFYFPESSWVITGDVLFQGSIGRTDLIGGNHALLLRSIREKLLTLPGDTVVYPGHGPATTIADESYTNPYL